MSFLFVYYADRRKDCIYSSVETWLDMPLITGICPTAKAYVTGTHKLHSYGILVKNFGMRSSIILEVQDVNEMIALRLLDDQVCKTNFRSKKNIKLHHIFGNIDWAKINLMMSEFNDQVADYQRSNLHFTHLPHSFSIARKAILKKMTSFQVWPSPHS